MILTPQLKNEIKEFALSRVPEEVCGLLIEVNKKIELYKCQNISYHKTIHSILNPLDFVHASKRGKIVAHIHSHEEKGTSILDNLNAYNHNIYSIVYSWKYDKFYIINPELKNYLNLDFELGKNDCYELIRNYYKNELGINLSSYPRDENWYVNNPKIILENFEKEGGIKIDFKDIKINDVIVFNIDGIPSHFAIYMGDNFILHHPRGDKSLISEITDSLKRRIILVIRHKNFI